MGNILKGWLLIGIVALTLCALVLLVELTPKPKTQEPNEISQEDTHVVPQNNSETSPNEGLNPEPNSTTEAVKTEPSPTVTVHNPPVEVEEVSETLPQNELVEESQPQEPSTSVQAEPEALSTVENKVQESSMPQQEAPMKNTLEQCLLSKVEPKESPQKEPNLNGYRLFFDEGTEVQAVVSGTVPKVYEDPYRGWTLYLVSGTQCFLYGGFSEKPNIEEGSQISCGQVLGQVGKKGLLFDAQTIKEPTSWWQGHSIDPQPWLANDK